MNWHDRIENIECMIVVIIGLNLEMMVKRTIAKYTC